MLCLKHLHHLPLFLSKFDFILEHKLAISFLLNSPFPLFLSRHCLQLLLFYKLHLSLVLYLGYLLGSKTLEVVGDEPVAIDYTFCGCWVFSHEIAVVDIGDLKLVLPLLVLAPLLLPVSLFLGKTLVLLLHLLHHCVTLLGHLVFKHSSHAVQGQSLL